MKHILKYLKRTRDYILVYSSGSLKTLGYTDSDFQGDIEYSSKSTSGYVFTLNGEPFVGERVFEKHVNCMGLKRVPGLL